MRRIIDKLLDMASDEQLATIIAFITALLGGK